MRWLPLSPEAAEQYCSDIPVEEQINLLHLYLKQHLDEIRALYEEGRGHTYLEILLFSLLDTLGSVTSNSSKGGGQRIREFVEKLEEYSELCRYSVPALLHVIDPDSSDMLSRLRQRCQELFELHFEPGCLPEICMDLSAEEIKSLIGTITVLRKNNPKVELCQCSHSRMLASKRNSLVHQLVRKGLRSSWNRPIPHYVWIGSDHASNTPDNWDIVYPVQYLIKLCDYGLSFACGYLRDNNIRPYSALVRSSSWLSDKQKAGSWLE
ncbi:MAG: hypothetical protein ACOYLI_04330 [Synechococcus lacustris]